MNAVIGVVAILAMFLILVVPHEFGHFGAAKVFGIRVHEYSLGLGRKIAGFTRGGTLYALRLVPVAGYVRLAGMEPGEYDDPEGFHRRPAWKRLLVLFAGPAANFVVAAALMTGVYAAQVNSDPGLVHSATGPAAAAGLRPGDSIRAVDGQPLRGLGDLVAAEKSRGNEGITLTVRHHDGTTSTITVIPVYDQGLKRWVIGMQAAPVATAGDAIVSGVTFPVRAVALIFAGLGQVIGGQIPGGFFGPQGATGVIGMGALTYEAAGQGLMTYFGLVALLSVALGVTNLLPLPALDGGRAVVVIAERLRGRPFDRDREMAVQRAGMVALLALMAVIAFLDVQRLATGQFPGFK